MWIRFWHKANCSAGDAKEEFFFAWRDGSASEEQLMDEAREAVPEWMQYSDSGYKYGFERIRALPASDRAELIRCYRKHVADAEKMLDILEHPEVFEVHEQ